MLVRKRVIWELPITTPNNMKLAFLASRADAAQAAATMLQQHYGRHSPESADVLVVLGGDGYMLSAMHRYGHLEKAFYGMRLGKVGFLLNDHNPDQLPQRIAVTEAVELKPIAMQATDIHGRVHNELAINEVAIWRQTNQAAHLRVLVNGVVRMEELVADGILLATAAGSTAYNLSVQGPIIPLGTEALALTPISPFRPRRWRGAILPVTSKVTIEVLSNERRPVSATADSHEVRDVLKVDMQLSDTKGHRLLFDPDRSLAERILKEQFS